MNEVLLASARRQAGVHPALVDLAFVLVFLFLILSTLADTSEASESEAEVAEQTLPPLDLPEIEAGDSLSGAGKAHEVITLRADGALLLAGADVPDLAALEERLAAAGIDSIELRASASVPYGEVAALLGLFHKLGIDEVSLAYETQS